RQGAARPTAGARRDRPREVERQRRRDRPRAPSRGDGGAAGPDAAEGVEAARPALRAGGAVRRRRPGRGEAGGSGVRSVQQERRGIVTPVAEEPIMAVSAEVATLFLEELARRNIPVSVNDEGYYVIERGGLTLTINLENVSRDFEEDRDAGRGV